QRPRGFERHERDVSRRRADQRRTRVVADLRAPQLSRLHPQEDLSRHQPRVRLQRRADEAGLRPLRPESAARHPAWRTRGVQTAGAARITPGVRIDRWRLTNDTLASPWVNGELRVGSRTTLRAGTGIYRQFPDLEQVYGQHAGGTGLQPERAVHIDAGIERSL